METHSLRVIFVALFFVAGANSQASFTFVNRCGFTVWPGVLSNAGVAPLSTTGFALQTGESLTIAAPSGWGGRFWGRTFCSYGADGRFSCATGDCGSGQVACVGAGAAPPATLAEFTLDDADGKDFYDISLVDGYNLPMIVVPQGGTGVNCTSAGCMADLNAGCPSELRVESNVGGGVACKSACEAFRSDEYCCSGAFGTPSSCQPSQYARMFKSACPQAYSYAYDDQSSTFTCTGADYVVTFCPSPNTSQKTSSEGQNPSSRTGRNGNPPVDTSMVYQGSGASSPASASSPLIAGAVAVATVTLWRSVIRL